MDSGWLAFQIRLSIYSEFSIKAGVNIYFNPKDKVTLEFGIILSLMLIVSQWISLNSKTLNIRFYTEINLSIDLDQKFAFRLNLSLIKIIMLKIIMLDLN